MAHEEYEKSLKDYCGNYNVDDIIVEECYRDLYIKGPDFIDWWTIVEVQTTGHSYNYYMYAEISRTAIYYVIYYVRVRV